jgi:hypothetical protein
VSFLPLRSPGAAKRESIPWRWFWGSFPSPGCAQLARNDTFGDSKCNVLVVWFLCCRHLNSRAMLREVGASRVKVLGDLADEFRGRSRC